MRIAFMGKGGSGKTTLTAAFAQYLAKQEEHILVLDGDVNVHLGEALKMESIPLSKNKAEVIEYFEPGRGIPIIGTTPPTSKSRYIRPTAGDEFLKKFSTQKGNMSLLTVGTYDEADVGYSCYHGKLSVLEIIFHRLLDQKHEIVIADATAGIDSLGTSLFFASDVNYFVVEPTLKSIGVYKDFIEVAQDHNLKTFVVANKVNSEADVMFLKNHIDEEKIVVALPSSDLLREFEQGDERAMEKFIESQGEAFERLKKHSEAMNRNWDEYYQKLLGIYETNCLNWYNSFYDRKLEHEHEAGFSYEKMMALHI